MARTRLIKPGFFKNEELAECDVEARILFAGLWTIADREGRLEDRPKRIKAEILPYDAVDVDMLLAQLMRHGFITRYTCQGQKYIQVEHFILHQQPHYKEEESHIPAPDGHTDSAYVAFGVTEKERQSIFDRDGRACVLCGSTEKLSLDHIIPRSKGGTDDHDNLQTLCGSCNSSKNNRLASETIKQAPSNKEVMSVQRQSNVGSSKVLDDPLNPLTLNLDTSSLSNTPAAIAAPGEKAKRKHRIPDSFCLTEDMIAFAKRKGFDKVLDLEKETDEFHDYWRGRGEPMLDWVATWQSRIRSRAEIVSNQRSVRNGQTKRAGLSSSNGRQGQDDPGYYDLGPGFEVVGTGTNRSA